MQILQDINKQLQAWNCYPDGADPNSPYRSILKARDSDNSNVDASGCVTQEKLCLIKKVLRDYFNMDHQVDDTFPSKLSKKLQDDKIKSILVRFRNLKIDSIALNSVQKDTKILYDELSKQGTDGLSYRGDHFHVGATKTMNFLFPELFIMFDKWVAVAIWGEKTSLEDNGFYNNFDEYWSALELCYDEIKSWCKMNGSTKKLVALDCPPPSTPIRIFDKCAWVLGNPRLNKFYIRA